LASTLLFRHHTGAARGLFLFLAILGLVFAGMAVGVAVVGDIRAEYPFRVRLRNGTRLLTIAAGYFVIVYLTQFVTFSRDVSATRRDRVRQWWSSSPSLRIFLAIVAGVLLVPLLGSTVAWLTDGGGYGRPFSLAPVIEWPRNARLVFWELLPAVLGHSGLVPVILTMAFVCGLGAVVVTQRRTHRDEVLLFGGVTLSTILLVVTSSYTVDISVTRYLMPLLLSLPATVYLVGQTLQRSVRIHSGWLWIVITVGLAANAFLAPASVFSRERPADVMDVVVRRLGDLKVHTVMGDYWTVYPIAFLSRGQILVAPVDGIDRFPSMSQRVRAAGPDAFVFSETAPSLESFRQSREATAFQSERLSSHGKSGPVFFIFRRPVASTP
jgi:hypothetical protein